MLRLGLKIRLKRKVGLVLTVLLLLNGFSFVMPAPTAEAANQNAYRWRNDDGTEVSATWAAAENTPVTDFTKNVSKRLRFGATNSGTDTEFYRKAAIAMQTGEDNFRTAVIDASGTYAYFGTDTLPGQVVKVRLSDFTRIGSLAMNTGENKFYSSAIDDSAGYAYFGAMTYPAKIIKVRLSDFTRVGSLTLNTGEDRASVIVIDSSGPTHYAYVATYTSPGQIVKINLSTFSRVGAFSLGAGENSPTSGVIDSASGTAYFATYTAPGKIAKVDLGGFSEVGSPLSLGENYPYSAAIDATGPTHYAYFGTYTAPAQVAKVNLTTFTESLPALSFLSGENYATQAAIDTSNGYAYFTTYGYNLAPGSVVKVRLSDFSRNGGTQVTSTNPNPQALVVDPAGSYAYVGAYNAPGDVIKVRTSDMTQVASISYGYAGDNAISSSVVDSVNGYAYFGTGGSGHKVIKVRLSDGARMGDVELPSDEYNFMTAQIDVSGGYAYFISHQAPSRVIKIRLSDFSRVGAITLNSGENNPHASFIDPSLGYLYVVADLSPAKIVRISLSTFQRVDSLDLNSGETSGIGSVVDLTGPTHYAYLGTYDSPAKVARVNLNTFTRVDALTLSTGINNIYAATIDTANGYGYFGTYTSPGIVVKVNLSTMTESASTTLQSGENILNSSGIDTVNGYAYFTTNTGPVRAVRIKLSDNSRVDAITLGGDENYSWASAMDVARGYFYSMTYTQPGILVKILVSPKPRGRLEYALKTSTCAAAASWTTVASSSGLTGANEAFQMSSSPFVTDGLTTTNVASGVTDGNTNFSSGYVQTAYPQAPEVAAGERQFSEMEWSFKPTQYAVPQATYCFRMTDAGTPLLGYPNYAEATVRTVDPTSQNSLHFARLKTGATGSFSLTFTLQNTLSGALTVTFPAGFTVVSSATSGASSPCLSSFNSSTTTLTAVKTACSGAVTLGGATVTNPGSPGIYVITWVNDDPGSATVIIVTDDQIGVTGNIDPSLTFNVGSQASATACDGTFSGNGGTLSLGTLSSSFVTTSDATSTPHICTRVSTNAASGVSVSVKSLNSALTSVLTPADSIPSSTATLAPGVSGYGLCAGSSGSDYGTDSTVPVGALPVSSSPFNSTCTTSAHNVGGLTSSFQSVWSLPYASQNAFARLYVKAAISATVPAHNDYADTLTFVATGTY